VEEKVDRSKQKKHKIEKKQPKSKDKPKEKKEKEKKDKIIGKVQEKEVVKSTTTLATPKVSEAIEVVIKEFQIAWDKADASKTKRFPPELDGLFYKICKMAKEEQGFLSQSLMERLSFLPFAIATLKARFNKLSSLDMRVKTLQEELQVQVDKLKTKLTTKTPETPLFDTATEELIHDIIANKYSLTKAQNSKRKLEGISTEILIQSELPEFLKKIVTLFPNDKEVVVDINMLNGIYAQVKKTKTQEEKKGKQSAESSKTQDKKPVVALSERRKKKSESPQITMVHHTLDLNDPQ